MIEPLAERVLELRRERLRRTLTSQAQTELTTKALSLSGESIGYVSPTGSRSARGDIAFVERCEQEQRT